MTEPQGMPDPTAGLGELPPEPGTMPTPIAPEPEPVAVPTEGEPGQPAPEPVPEEPAEYTEADRIKELGLGEYNDFGEALSARERAYVDSIKAVFSANGMFLQGNTAEELTAEIDYYARQAKSQEPAPQSQTQEAGFKIDLETLYKELDGAVEIDDSMKKLLGSLTGKISSAVDSQLREVQSHASAELTRMQDRIWYNDAKSQAGEGPIPSVSEASKMLQQNPKLREQALYRQRIFGDEAANPMVEVISQYRAGKTGTGLTKAQEAKVAAEAESVRRFKRQLTPGPVTPPKPVSPDKLKDADLRDGIYNIPISRAFPGMT